MKKLLIVVLTSLAFLLGSSIVCYGLSALTFDKAWKPLVIGSIIIVVALILIIISRKKLFLILVFISNMIALGFLIKAWHVFKSYNLLFSELLIISLFCVIYLVLFYFLSYIPLFSNHYKLFLVIFLLASLAIYLVLIWITTTYYLSTYGYYMIVEIGFLLALSVYTSSKKELFKTITISTFIVIIVAIIIALIMLDADLDFGFFDENFDIMSPKEQKRTTLSANNLDS